MPRPALLELNYCSRFRQGPKRDPSSNPTATCANPETRNSAALSLTAAQYSSEPVLFDVRRKTELCSVLEVFPTELLP